MAFEVTTSDGTTEIVAEADSYQQEGQLTTFFTLAAGRTTIDSWSVRVASYRTADLRRVRRLDGADDLDDTGDDRADDRWRVPRLVG